MATEKKGMSLPVKLLIGIAAGIICGLFLPESVMTIVVTLKYVLNQLIMFCVPLIVIGFIAPSITKMGSNATRMLVVAIVIAYVSTVLATLMSMVAGYVLVPFLPIASTMEGLKDLPDVAFQLDIPQIMGGQDDGRFVPLIDLLDELPDGIFCLHIQADGGLVQKQEVWPLQQNLGKPQPGHFPARKGAAGFENLLSPKGQAGEVAAHLQLGKIGIFVPYGVNHPASSAQKLLLEHACPGACAQPDKAGRRPAFAV